MNRITTIMLAVALCLAANVRAAEKLSHTVTVDYSGMVVDTVTHSSGEKFLRLDIAGLDNVAETDEPTIPVKLLTFEVPTYVNDFNVTLNSYTTVGTRTLPLALAPMECHTTDEVIDGVSKPVVYGAGYSATPTVPVAEVVDEYFVDGLRHFVTVRVTPVLYTHATRSVRLCDRLSVSLAYDDCTAADMKFTPIKVAKGVQFVHTIDDSTLAAKSSRRVKAQATSGTLQPQIKEYLILVPDNLKEGVDRLVAWKKQKGYNVKVQTFESIYALPAYKVGSNADCFDEAASVREWMKKYYADHGAFYCLIIGDYRTSAPIRKFRFDLRKILKREVDWTDSNCECYVPTDLYFTDLTTCWQFEISEAGIYVQKNGNDSFSPAIPVGRLLCETKEQIQNFTDKVLLYESNPGRGNTSYLTNGLLAQHQDLKDYANLFDNLSMNEVSIFQSNAKMKFEDLKPTAQEVLSKINDCGLLSFQCHGTATGIILAKNGDTSPAWHASRWILALSEYREDDPSAFWENNIGLDEMHNIDRPSICYSMACDIAPFDGTNGWKNKEYNFVSSFTTGKEYGGPCCVANTRIGIFSPIFKKSRSTLLEYEFGRNINSNQSLGGILNSSRISFNEVSEYAFFLKSEHSVIGDPELKIWLHAPSKLPVKATLDNGILSLSNFKTKANSLGFRSGNSSYIGTFIITSNPSVPIQDFITVKPNSILSVYIQTPEYLPETILIPTGDRLDGVNEHYVLNRLQLGSKSVEALLDSYNPIDLNLNRNCNLSLFVYDSVFSDKGINITGKSTLSIESEKDVTLKGDKISGQGTLNVTAGALTLKEGFEIAKGSTFDFHNR